MGCGCPNKHSVRKISVLKLARLTKERKSRTTAGHAMAIELMRPSVSIKRSMNTTGDPMRGSSSVCQIKKLVNTNTSTTSSRARE
jgi:hypothetical protein